MNEESPSSFPNIELDSIIRNTIPECARAACIQKAAQYKELDAKYKALKNVYFILASHYAELNIKNEALLKAKSHIDQLDIGGDTALPDDLFTKNEMRCLQAMSLEKGKDSTFILQCLEFVYKNDLSLMRSKTLKGKAESVQISDDGTSQIIPAKEPLTPIKIVRIKELFLERLSKCDVNSAVYAERIKESNINKLIASGIKNIAKKLK